jgi:hypothetical protein
MVLNKPDGVYVDVTSGWKWAFEEISVGANGILQIRMRMLLANALPDEAIYAIGETLIYQAFLVFYGLKSVDGIFG